MGDSNSEGSVSLDRPFQNHKVFTHLAHVACTSLFDRSGRFGCSTDQRGDSEGYRIVHWSNSAADKASTEKYVAVFAEDEFTDANVATALSDGGGAVRGLLVLNHTTSSLSSSTQRASPGPVYPNGYSTPAASMVEYTNGQYAWNPTGDSLVFRDLYGVPAAMVERPDTAAYAYEQSRVEGNDVVLSFNYYMGPEKVNSFECLDWRDADGEPEPMCLPLGGQSVLAYAGTPPPSSNDDGSFAARDLVLLATSIDATAVFHDAAPGANAAASGLMATLLAARLIGKAVDRDTLDSYSKQIAFGFFQGETYGYMGSRSFLRDRSYPGLTCQNKVGDGCAYPLRPNLNFLHGGKVASMLAVDQVGVLSTANTLYVHATDNDDGNVANVLYQFDGVQKSNAGNIPPSPLVSLVELSEAAIGGAVLSGYDDAYADPGDYQSQRDTVEQIDLDAIRQAAVLVARTGLAVAATDDDGDYETAAATAATLIPDSDAVDDDDYEELVASLFDCLFRDAYCDFWNEYVRTERRNEARGTGVDLGRQTARATTGTVPNYYVSVYDPTAQAALRVSGKGYYGAYNETLTDNEVKNAVYVHRPSALEAGIHGLANEFLGANDQAAERTKCSSSRQCENNDSQSCPATTTSVCTGSGRCACSVSFYHLALDEAIEPVPMTECGRFRRVDGEAGVSPVYTEPNWSASVGVSMYRAADADVGPLTLAVGALTLCASALTTLALRRWMVREKLY